MEYTLVNRIKLFLHTLSTGHKDSYRYGPSDAFGVQHIEHITCSDCGYGHRLDKRGHCDECGSWADARIEHCCPLASNLWERKDPK